MVINLLDVSRLEEGSVDLKYEPVVIEDVLRSCDRIGRSAAQLRGQELVIQSGSAVAPVRGDAKALRRVFCTMIENAVKYTRPGGRIVVTAGPAADQQVVIHICDNGRGIHAADLPHIFEKFYRGTQLEADGDPTGDEGTERSETPGVGLGLYLASQLVRALDGRIAVESTVGSGSRFSVYLNEWNDALHRIGDDAEYGFDERDVRHG
jgi:two-component system phosphate regulon sensor histidine kinase PhoR